MRFFLGCHQPAWLADAPFPLCVAHRRLAPRLGPRARTPLPVARSPWFLDSSAFSELRLYGQWTITPGQYLAAVHRYRAEIGRLEHVACQDWMCEDVVRTGGRVGKLTFVGTGLSVEEHQRLTVDNALTLFDLDPTVPWVPALQGQTVEEYLRCADLYEAHGIDLASLPLVGLGSVCRRQATPEIIAIVEALAPRGYRLHGYGVKSKGLSNIGPLLASSDSMAWSYRGRHVPGCQPGHKTESNCYPFAGAWRARMLANLTTDQARLRPGDGS